MLFPLSGSEKVLFFILETKDAFHFSSGTTLAHSGTADEGRLIPDITCLMISTCSETSKIKIHQNIFAFIWLVQKCHMTLNTLPENWEYHAIFKKILNSACKKIFV